MAENLGITTLETWGPEAFFAGNLQKAIPMFFTVALTATALPRGSIMGIITASGKLKLTNVASTDGSEVPFCVLSNTIDATAADVLTTVFVAGEFNKDALNAGSTITTAMIQALARVNIYLRAVEAA